MYGRICNRNWCRVTSNDQFSSSLTHIAIEVIIIKFPHNTEIRNHELGGKSTAQNPTLSLRFISRDFTIWNVYFVLRGSGVRGTVEWRARRRVEFKAKATWSLREIDFGKKVTHAAPSGLIGVLVSSCSFMYEFWYFFPFFLCNLLIDFKMIYIFWVDLPLLFDE